MSLPATWATASIEELFNTVGGGTPSTAKAEYWSGSIPWISSADISDDHQLRVRRFITQAAVQDSATNMVPAGSVIVVTRVGLGKVAIAPKALCFSQDSQALLFFSKNFNPAYVLLYMSTAVKVFKHISRGTTINGVTKKQLLELDFVLPPRSEQNRIVAEIEKQFTRLDDAVVALRRVQTNLKRYRASVLKAACEGRLVPTEAELARKEGRSYEPASELLKRILAERRVKWKGTTKYVEPSPPANDLPELPNGWVWATMSQLLREPLRNGHSAKESLNGEGVRTLTLTAVTYGNFTESNVKVTSANPEKVRDLWIQPGDIFVERSNAPELVGIARLFSGSPNFAIFPDLLIRVRLSLFVEPRYVEALLLSGRVRHYFRASSQGISGSMPKIDQGIIETLAVPLPPIAEQKSIAIEIENRLAQLTASEHEIVRGLRLAGNLRQAILKKAFSGQLVPQDPADEPASVLLERIRAERAALATNNGNQKAIQEVGTAKGQRRRRVAKLAQGVSPGKRAEK